MITPTETQTDFSTIIADNNKRIKDIELFKSAPISRKTQFVAFSGLALGSIIVASIFAMQILSGILALATLAAFTVGGFYLVRVLKQADPLIQQKIKNKVLEKMYEEASAHAIEQLTNHVIYNADKLDQSRKARNSMGALIENLAAKVNATADTSTNKPRMLATLEKLRTAYAQVTNNIDKAAIAHKNFEQRVNDYRDMDKFNKEAGQIMAMFESSGTSKLNEMLTLEAFASIDQDFSTAIISIENSAKDAAIDAKE